MGNQTQGTYGSAHMFGISSPHLFENHEYLNNKLNGIDRNADGFGIITDVNLVGNYVEPIELKTANDIGIFTLPLNYHINTIQKGPE